METPVWCLNSRWRYEGLRWNSRARLRTVKVAPVSTIRRIFRTRASGFSGANGRGGPGVGTGEATSGVVTFARFLPEKLTRGFEGRSTTSARNRLVRCMRLDWLEGI